MGWSRCQYNVFVSLSCLRWFHLTRVFFQNAVSSDTVLLSLAIGTLHTLYTHLADHLKSQLQVPLTAAGSIPVCTVTAFLTVDVVQLLFRGVHLRILEQSGKFTQVQVREGLLLVDAAHSR